VPQAHRLGEGPSMASRWERGTPRTGWRPARTGWKPPRTSWRQPPGAPSAWKHRPGCPTETWRPASSRPWARHPL